MGPWLLAALLQIQPPQAKPAVEVNAPERPRFTIGGQFSGIAVTISEGGHFGFGAGLTASIPAGSRTAIDLRVTHLLPAGGFGVYDARWRRMLKTPRNGKPDYFAAGIAGFYYVHITYRGNIRREDRRISYPQMLSLATGWSNPVGRFSVPVEAGVLVHPYGLLVATGTIGVSWTPRGPAGER